jgi:hypothetical protein
MAWEVVEGKSLLNLPGHGSNVGSGACFQRRTGFA